jgi:hypothetical protein
MSLEHFGKGTSFSSHRSAFGRADESSAHTAVFFVVSGCVLYALLCGIVGRCIAGAGYVGNWGALELICGRPFTTGSVQMTEAEWSQRLQEFLTTL